MSAKHLKMKVGTCIPTFILGCLADIARIYVYPTYVGISVQGYMSAIHFLLRFSSLANYLAYSDGADLHGLFLYQKGALASKFVFFRIFFLLPLSSLFDKRAENLSEIFRDSFNIFNKQT